MYSFYLYLIFDMIYASTYLYCLMGKQGHQDNHQHHDHQDHHDHHQEHTSELHHDHAPEQPTYISHKPNDPLNFTKKHALFDIQLEKKGPEFSEIDDRRFEYIQKYAGKVPLTQIHVPKNIPGLVPKVGDLPANRKLWRATGSFERNGVFNAHTHSFNTRFILPFFFSFLLYGWWGHATYAYYKGRYEDNDEWLGNFYDKLNTRFPPPTKMWLRPG